jgi:hypothetical protein
MIYKLEHVTDLESGAILAATARRGDERNTRGLGASELEAGEIDARVRKDPNQPRVHASPPAAEV